MSSLIFHLEPEQVLVGTDTLATSVDGEPFLFTTKVFIVPHLRLLMAGTGAGGFLGKWFTQVNDRMVVRDVDNLDFHAPRDLAQIWQNHKNEFSLPEDASTTVYHFGFSEEDGLIHSYVYRSENSFQSERLGQSGIGVKPECQVPEGCQLPADIKTMMLDQRAIQAMQPKAQKVYIGGEIVIHHLSRDGFQVYTLDKFEDYEITQQAIFSNFHS